MEGIFCMSPESGKYSCLIISFSGGRPPDPSYGFEIILPIFEVSMLASKLEVTFIATSTTRLHLWPNWVALHCIQLKWQALTRKKNSFFGKDYRLSGSVTLSVVWQCYLSAELNWWSTLVRFHTLPFYWITVYLCPAAPGLPEAGCSCLLEENFISWTPFKTKKRPLWQIRRHSKWMCVLLLSITPY